MADTMANPSPRPIADQLIREVDLRERQRMEDFSNRLLQLLITYHPRIVATLLAKQERKGA